MPPVHGGQTVEDEVLPVVVAHVPHAVVEVPTAPLVEELLLDGSHSDQMEEVEVEELL